MAESLSKQEQVFTDGLSTALDEPVSVDDGSMTVEAAFDAILDTVRELGMEGRFTRDNGLDAIAVIPGDETPLALRDLPVVLEACPELLSDEMVVRTCLEIATCQLPDGQFPDMMRADGTPIYNHEDDPDRQIPNTDCGQFMVWLVWLALQRTGDNDFASDIVPKLVKGIENLARGERTQLVCVPPDVQDFGSTCPFAPGAEKRGDLLTSSLLLVQAFQQLADIVQHLGRDGDADMWRAEAQLVAKRIRMYFWDKTPGLFRAATNDCTQHDIWGSTLSVYLNVATSGQLVAISRYCSENYDDVVRNGHVRAMPADEYWATCDVPEGEFENGGFWAGAAGWLAYTVDILDPPLADRVITDLAVSFTSDGVFKALNKDGIGRFRDYLPSAAAPVPGIQKMLARRRKREEQATMMGDF